MAELHRNQIQWQAPDPVHAQIARRDDILAPQIRALGDEAIALADTVDRINDVEFASNLKQTSAAMLQNLKNVQRTDNNYEGVKQEWLSKLQDVYMSAPESARIRFARENPNFMDEAVLSADKLIIEKQQRYETVRIGNLIPQMASNVTEGLSSYETERNNLQSMVANLPNEIAEQYMFNFDDAIIKDKIDDLISAHRFQDALDMLDDVKGSYTLDPAYRNTKRNVIQNSITQIRAEQQRELDRLQKENDYIERVNADIAAGGTGEVSGRSSSSGGSTETKINKTEQGIIEKWLDEIAMDYPAALADVKSAISNPSDKITRLPNGQYIQGRFAYSADGKQLWSLNDIEPGVIIDAIEARMSKAKKLAQVKDEIITTQNDIQTGIGIFLEKKKAGDDESAYNALSEAVKIAETAAAKEYAPDQVKEIRAYSDADLDALSAAAGSYSTIGSDKVYKHIANKGVVSHFATGAGAGAAIGSTFGPLGTLGGAVIGGATALGLESQKTYRAESGQAAIRSGWRNYEKQDNPEYDKLVESWQEGGNSEPMPRLFAGNPQFDPTKTPGYNGLNDAQKLLRDPVYALRTGIHDVAQYMEDEHGIKIEGGSFGERLTGQFVAINIEDAQGLQDLGLSPMLLGSRKIAEAYRETLLEARKNTLLNKNPTQVAANELDAYNEQARAMFDLFFMRLQGGINVKLTEEQQRNRDKLYEFIVAGTSIDGPLGMKYALETAGKTPVNYGQKRLDGLVKQGIKGLYK